jgi:Mg2+ and Co2+ transporter CorA
MPFQYYYISKLEDKTSDFLNSKNINPLDIEELFNDTDITNFSENNEYKILNIQLPEYDSDNQLIIAKKIKMIIAKEYLVVFDEDSYKNLEAYEVIRKANKPEFATPNDQAISIVDFLVSRLFRITNKLKDGINDNEKSLFNFQNTKSLILNIHILHRNIIEFQSIISSLGIKTFALTSNSLGIKINRLTATVTTMLNQIILLNNSNQSVITKDMNDTVTTFKKAFLYLTIPILIFSFFGSNILNVLSHISSGFYLVTLLIIVVLCGALLLSKRKIS